MEIDILIDSLTNCLIDSKTGQECDTEFRLVRRTISKADARMLQNTVGNSIGASLIKTDIIFPGGVA